MMKEAKSISTSGKDTKTNLPAKSGKNKKLKQSSYFILSLFSWPEKGCDKRLKPMVVLCSSMLWFSLMVAATVYLPPPGEIPIIAAGIASLLAGFFGGSIIAIISSLSFLTVLYLGLITPRMTEIEHLLIGSGYYVRDFIICAIFAWLYGVPHWRKKYSIYFTISWGAFIVSAPFLYILLDAHAFYGYIPKTLLARLIDSNAFVYWLLTASLAAITAKIMYIIKDKLRQVLP